MSIRPVSTSLILAIVVCCGPIACGKYGPPVRVYDQQEPASQTSDADDDEDKESEPQPDQP